MTRPGRAVAALAGALLAAYAAATLLGWRFADRWLFRPPAPTYDALRLPVDLTPHPAGGDLAVWHLPNPAASHTLLFSHGNGEDLGAVAPRLRALHAAGFAVLAYDYRGYGLSRPGPPSARKAEADHAAAYAHLRALGAPPSRIVLHGYSLGAGPAVELAARAPVAGLIVESGFVSAYRVAHPWLRLPLDRFPSARRLRNVACPVLVIHGGRDRIVPAWHGERLYQAAPEPRRRFFVPEAGHTDLPAVAGPAYFETLRDFVSSLDHGSQRDAP